MSRRGPSTGRSAVGWPIAMLALALVVMVAGLAALPIDLGAALTAAPGSTHFVPAAGPSGAAPPLGGPTGSGPASSDSPAASQAGELAQANSAGPIPLAGCPLPSRPPFTGPPIVPPHPAGLVPEASLPSPPPPAPRTHQLSVLSGKGLWIWQLGSTEGGDPGRIVARARAAGLHQLWVRVGDSFDGFYAGPQLGSLVPAAHRVGIAVIGWGFPYLYDPVSDAGWSRAALDWRGPEGPPSTA